MAGKSHELGIEMGKSTSKDFSIAMLDYQRVDSY